MFIKLFLQPDACRVFRIQDIVSIDPVFTELADVTHYDLRLANSLELIQLTDEQAFKLIDRLQTYTIRSPYCD